MKHQEALPVRRFVNGIHFYDHAAEVGAAIIAKSFIMISGDIDNLGALSGLPQKLLDDIIVRLRPIPGPLQPPSVNDIPNQIDLFCVVVRDEIQEKFGLTAPGSQMDIGDK